MTVGTEPKVNSETVPKEDSKQEIDSTLELQESVNVELDFVEYTEPTPKQHVDRACANEVLAAHNKYRFLHSSPKLRISEDLNAYAQQWAEEIANNDDLEHSVCELSTGERIGENVYAGWDSNPGREAVTCWYDEIKDYNYRSQTITMNTGHFTQVIWKDTKEIGVGKALSKSGCWYIVVNYRPPGNFVGEFKRNVLPKT